MVVFLKEHFGLRRLCVDLYVKWYGEHDGNTSFWDLYEELQDIPSTFLEQVFRRRKELCYETADRKCLWLRQYCCHGDDNGNDVATGCQCQRLDATNVIR